MLLHRVQGLGFRVFFGVCESAFVRVILSLNGADTFVLDHPLCTLVEPTDQPTEVSSMPVAQARRHLGRSTAQSVATAKYTDRLLRR